MISKLDIVKGCFKNKDTLPVLTHIHISGGKVTTTNGRLTISTDIAELVDLDVIVPADKFIRAVRLCKTPNFKVTPAGKLSISKGKTRIYLPVLNSVFPNYEQDGTVLHAKDLLLVLEKLLPFVSEDASRPWSCGVLLYSGTAYATNNVLLVKTKVDWTGPPINLPSFLIKELLRLKMAIKDVTVHDTSITVNLEDAKLHSVLLSTKWPNIDKLLDSVDTTNIKPISEDLLVAVESIVPFCPDDKFPKIQFTEDGVSTEDGEHTAIVNYSGLEKSIWRAEPLLTLLTMRDPYTIQVDFTKWPAPCPWARSDGLVGLIIGLKQ